MVTLVSRERTLETYRNAAVVSSYDHASELHQAEALLFREYVKPGSEVLDLGVGAGRTTPHLVRLASRYVGVDYSDAMIARCREKFPGVTFLNLDASDLSGTPSASFDVVVFSFNGIDTIPTLERRRRCLDECARVLRGGGVFIFSVHNARYLIFSPMFDGVGPLRAGLRISYAAVHSLANLVSRLPSSAFWRGRGYVFDPLLDGGLTTYVASPGHVRQEASCAGFDVARRVPAQFPADRGSVRTPWYYYACVKRGG
jgi:ubiquinone/menaquinone biosynthesis C-methylase UbiE